MMMIFLSFLMRKNGNNMKTVKESERGESTEVEEGVGGERMVEREKEIAGG